MKEPRVVAITGGGRRLGRALALTFAQRGYDVGILGRSPDELERVKLEISEIGSRCTRPMGRTQPIRKTWNY